MSIFGKLTATPERKKNVDLLRLEMTNAGFTNPYLQAAILGVIAKESGFLPKSEVSYQNTAADRIKTIFSSHFKNWSNSDIDKIKAAPKQFFDKIYGGRYGNAADEGYKYRGRGFNQLTFKGNYQSAKNKTGIDIVSDPDRANDPEVAAKIVIAYFDERFSKYPSNVKDYVTSGLANDVDSLDKAIELAAHANAGWSKSKTGYALSNAIGNTKEYAPFMYAYLKANQAIDATSNFVKKNKKPILIFFTLGTIATIAFVVMKKIKK